MLSQWLSRAAASVSKAQVCKLVEIYDITGNLPPRLKQVILLLADLYGNGSHTEEDENLPATASMQLLIELDSLLRYRTGALESVVLSMLLDKGQKNRRSGSLILSRKMHRLAVKQLRRILQNVSQLHR